MARGGVWAAVHRPAGLALGYLALHTTGQRQACGSLLDTVEVFVKLQSRRTFERTPMLSG